MPELPGGGGVRFQISAEIIPKTRENMYIFQESITTNRTQILQLFRLATVLGTWFIWPIRRANLSHFQQH